MGSIVRQTRSEVHFFAYMARIASASREWRPVRLDDRYEIIFGAMIMIFVWLLTGDVVSPSLIFGRYGMFA